MTCARARIPHMNAEIIDDVRCAYGIAAGNATENASPLAQRVEELESFVRALAHDAGALTRAIALRTELLRERIEARETDAATAILDGIAERTNRLGRMFDGLLRLARVGARDIQPIDVDLSSLALEIVADLRREHPDRMVDVCIRPAMSDRGDPVLVRLLLENLFGNAWKFTAGSPTARIRFGCRQHGDASPIYYIVDNGIGLADESSTTIFTPFVRLPAAHAYPGTGLGLAIAKRIVERHGGWIRADTSGGPGATFLFALKAQGTHFGVESAA